MRIAAALLLALVLAAPAAYAQTAETAATSAPQPAAPDMQPREIAVLQVLDKISARVTTLRVPVGVQAGFGQLVITPRACRVNPPSAPPEAATFLEIGEIDINSLARSAATKSRSTGQKLVFSGWMFASSPALSALEHPIYDVVVLKCESTAEAKAETETPAPVPSAPPKAADVPADEPAPLD